MKPDLARVLERLEWAEANFLRLDADMRTLFARFKNGETHSLDKEREAETGFRVYRLVVHEPIPSTAWALRISEVAHHARATLDNLIYALTIRHTKSPPDELLRAAALPFSKSADVFHLREKSGAPAWGSGVKKIQGIDPRAWSVVEALQPFPGRTGLPLTLANLDEFWNADKHRLPPIAATVGQHIKVNITGPAFSGTPEIGGVPLYMRETFAFENGAEVARYKPRSEELDLVMQSEFALRVRFAPGPHPWSGLDIGAFLKPALDGVRQSALLFDPFF